MTTPRDPGRDAAGQSGSRDGADEDEDTEARLARASAEGDTADEQWSAWTRHETPLQRLDRHWTELLQELRVVQTGIQLLTGILLTLPFQPRFAELSAFQQSVYLVTLVCAVLSGGLLIAPVALHRVLFRRRARRVTVQVAHRLALVGLGLLAVALVGIVLLIFDVVLGRVAAVVAAVVIGLVLLGLWLLLPLRLLEKAERGGFEPRGLIDPE